MERLRVEDVWGAIDAAFKRADERHPEAVSCKAGCGDCCGKVPSLWIEQFEGEIVRRHLAALDEAGRERIAKLASRDDQLGCRLLDENYGCSIWQARPIACRMFGLPFRVLPEMSWPDGKRRLPVLDVGVTEMEVQRFQSCYKNFGSVADEEIQGDVVVDVTAVKLLAKRLAKEDREAAPGRGAKRVVLLDVVCRELGLPYVESETDPEG